MKASRVVSFLALSTTLALPTFAMAQTSGECSGGNCGTPNQSGGSCGCGCGSILVANTDIGDTYSYSDDWDNDGFEDDFDNCPFVANLAQGDGDADGVGDSCDNCVFASNDLQSDVDADLSGDACDADADNDSILNSIDNCPVLPNTSQSDNDSDALGDACDTDDDADGVLDVADNCPLVANADQTPPAPGSACDQDIDNDGVFDSIDNCTEIANGTQGDADTDGLGDTCDSDADGDAIDNIADNCALVANADQTDRDRDRSGDLCDSRDCYVVDNPELCLDALSTFTVYAAAISPDAAIVYGATTGDELYLEMHANRDAAIRYTWVMVSRPDGSHATVENPSGSASFAVPGTYYKYTYDTTRPVLFTADRAGTYTFRLVADLAFADTLYPEASHSEHEVTVEVDGRPIGACSVKSVGVTGSASGLLVLLGLAGLVVARRRFVK